MADSTMGVCQALNLTDESKCSKPATNVNGLFCTYHARTAQGMYGGYKKRGAKLEALDAAPPPYLASSKFTLRNEDFSGVQDGEELRILGDWLYEKHRLLERVIAARKKHHSHFYAETMDYGHKSYLDKLVNDKNVVVAAITRLCRRTIHVRHKEKKWFSFIKERQDEEDATQEKEVVKIKKEGQLFKRYVKEMEARRELKKRREDKKRQEAFLDQAYEERMRQVGEESDESSDEWDPIEDILRGERDDLVSLMHRLLWLEMPQPPEDPEALGSEASEALESGSEASHAQEQPQAPLANKENVEPNADTTTGDNSVALTKSAKKRAKAKAKAKSAAESPKEDAKNDAESDGAKIEVNETREEMRKRLVRGLSAKEHGGRAIYEENGPAVPFDMPGIPESEVDPLLDEVAEVKELLLCRLIISQSNLLPIALRARNLAEFFADTELNLADLRDLCLRYEKPKLQEIRDACADLARGDGEESDNEEEDEDDEQTAHELAVQEKYKKDAWRRRQHDKRHRTKHEQKVEKKSKQRRQVANEGEGGDKVIVDFGEIDNEGKFQNRKVRVRVCGKSIWNYPSEKALARGGWYHFSVIAKGSRFEDAVQLCRNWNEFWELSNLVILNYFSSTTWVAQWSGQPTRAQQLQMGIISYLDFSGADRLTVQRQPGRRATGGRAQPAVQFKNVLCFCIKRNDPISRRFVQYLSMQTRYVCMMVRDAKTGKILSKPPEEHNWLIRIQGGLGKDDWIEKLHVGEDELYDLLEDRRSERWQFGFNDYYDITIWDAEPGDDGNIIWSRVHEAMRKARRICSPVELWDSVAPFMKSLHREVKESENEIGRVRDARPGESTLYDEVSGDNIRHFYRDVDAHTGELGETHYEQPKDYFYNEVDAAEDLILFPEEAAGFSKKAITGTGVASSFAFPDNELPNMKRFVKDLDTDEEDEDLDDPFEDKLDKLAIKNKPVAKDQVTAEEDWETEESENDWPEPPKDLSACPNPDATDCRCDECLWWDENDRELIPSVEYGVKRDGHVPINSLDVFALVTDPGEARRLEKFIFDEPTGSVLDRDPASDFTVFMDREKSKPFKKMWHAAVFDETLRQRWTEMQELVKDCRAAVVRDVAHVIESFHILMWLGVHPYEHKKVLDDMWDAMAAMALFFNGTQTEEFKKLLLDRTSQSDTGNPKLSDNEAKAKLLEPYARTPRSNLTQPKDFWENVDRVRKGSKGHVIHEFDLVCRPQLAQLAWCGIARPSYLPNPCGGIVATAEGGQEPHLTVDYRRYKEFWPTNMTHLRDPCRIHLLPLAQSFAQKHKNARFSVLRIWSHEVFYPLMLGVDNRENTCFEDTLSRAWEFYFVPKDMPGSEFSIQKSIEDRLYGSPLPQVSMGSRGGPLTMQPRHGAPRFLKLFKDRMEVKRDMVLIMGEDEKDLERLTTAATFVLQTNPWRLEIDFLKSFVNVDLEFLQGLDKKWLE